MRHRRRNLLINKKFQLKFSVFVCSWVMILTFAFPSFLFSAMETFTRVLSRKADATTLQVATNFQSEMITAVVIFMVIFAITVFFISLFMSHRIAGPVFRIQSALNRWSRGTVEKNIVLRKSDHFRELAKAYNEASEQFYKVKERTVVAADRLQKISEELQPKHRAQLQEIIAELQSVAQRR